LVARNGRLMKALLNKRIGMVFVLALVAQCVRAQEADQQGIPWKVRFSGKIIGRDRERALDRETTLRFAFYDSEDAQSPLYEEFQLIDVSATGSFSALLGSETRRTEFESLLQSSRAKWIGVREEPAGQEIRSMFVAVPYAFKAKDAETVNGVQSGEFVRQTQLRSAVLDLIRDKASSLLEAHNMAYRYPEDYRYFEGHIPRADLFPGVDACSKINAAIKSTNATGIVDATGFKGVQYCTVDMFEGIGQRAGEIWFSQANFQVTIEQNWPSNWRLRGMPGEPGKGTWFTWKGVAGKTIFKLNTVRWALMDGFNLDCSNMPASVGLALLTNYSSQHNRFENFSILNCATAVQWGDNGEGNSLNQADRVEFRHFDISAPVLQTIAKGFVINSSNSAQTSVIEDGQIVNLNVGIDIPHLESGIFSIKRVQCNLKGDNAAFIRMREVYDIHIEKTQCENNGLAGSNPAHLLVEGSNNLRATIALVGNTINFPIRIVPARSVVSIGNNGIASGYLFHPLTSLTSIGDRMGATYGDVNWKEPTVSLSDAELVRTNGIVTVSLLPISIATIRRSGNYSTVTTTKPHYLRVGQSFTISGTTNPRLNGSGAVCSNPPICPIPTDLSFTYEDFGSNEDSTGGSVQPQHGFVDGMLVSMSGVVDGSLNTSRASIQAVSETSFQYQNSGENLISTGGVAATSATLVTPYPTSRTRLQVTLNPGEQKQITVPWPQPFTDSAYTVNCTVVASKPGQLRFDLTGISQYQVQGRATNLDLAATTSGTLHCAAAHDPS
jgi:hypothetical protein